MQLIVPTENILSIWKEHCQQFLKQEEPTNEDMGYIEHLTHEKLKPDGAIGITVMPWLG